MLLRLVGGSIQFQCEMREENKRNEEIEIK